MATGELEYVSDEGIATEDGDSLTDITALPHDDFRVVWELLPSWLSSPKPLLRLFIALDFVLQPLGALFGHGPQRSQPVPFQPPVEVDVSKVRLFGVH